MSRKGAIVPHQLFAFYEKMAAFVGIGRAVDAMATSVGWLALASVLFLCVVKIL